MYSPLGPAPHERCRRAGLHIPPLYAPSCVPPRSQVGLKKKESPLVRCEKKDVKFSKSLKVLRHYKSLLTYEIVRSDRKVLSIHRGKNYLLIQSTSPLHWSLVTSYMIIQWHKLEYHRKKQRISSHQKLGGAGGFHWSLEWLVSIWTRQVMYL
jgi:hypothetical protein